MNECNEKFLERNGIDPQEIASKVDCKVYSPREINLIIDGSEMRGKTIIKNVSVADIVGITCKNGINNIFDTLDDYFDKNGDGYHIRSVGMLEYSKDNILDNLRISFEKEPIQVKETGEGTYIIFKNGLHRFTLLRILYLKELADANGDKEKIDKLKEKYTIPVRTTKINIDKTYCKYILNQIDVNEGDKLIIKDITNEYDENYKPTDNVEFFTFSGDKTILTVEELKNKTKDGLNKVLQSGKIPLYITSAMRYKSFRIFMSENMPDIFKRIEEQERIEK